MRRSALAPVVLTLGAAVLLVTPVSKASDYSDGVQLYAQKNYHAAAAKFEAAMRSNAKDANLIYYCAVSSQLSGNRARARQLYQYLLSSFPNSRAAAMSQTGLHQLEATAGAAGGGTVQDGGGSSGVGSYSPSVPKEDPEIAGVADEVRLPCTRKGTAIYVEGTVNGQAVLFHLDTGASGTVMGANMLEAAGISRPNNGQEFESIGVGSREHVKAWRQTVSLKVGPIIHSRFPLMVQDQMDGDPLLGQDFMRDFDVAVEGESNQVILRKKSALAHRIQARGTIDIPFTVGPGGHLIVETLVNGKKCEMYWDSGASGVAFSVATLRKVGIPMPDGPPTGKSQGIAGITDTWNITLDSFKVGKIEKENFQATVAQDSAMDRPLLGQSFFNEFNWTIDRKEGKIHLAPP